VQSDVYQVYGENYVWKRQVLSLERNKVVIDSEKNKMRKNVIMVNQVELKNVSRITSDHSYIHTYK